MKELVHLIKQHKAGKGNGVFSVCSSHPLVLEAALTHALRNNEYVIIEATSNQVNQFGGYTGKRPADFVALVESLADKVGLDRHYIILGGDHLGPNCWQDKPAEEAMSLSETLISEYVAAGFRKIHLDCSMSCDGDPVPLSDEVVAKRAARLCQIAEQTWRQHGGEPPVYIIGTEVPVPGGAQEELDTLELTTTDAAAETIAVHKAAFAKHDLQSGWERVIGLVVQPGVEFDHHKVIQFIPEKAHALTAMIEKEPTLVYEAHSTDYQSAANLRSLVQGHFAILKVGPWLTYALRDAVWALDSIEQEWIPEDKRANVKNTLLEVMKENPVYWKKYYTSTSNQLDLDRQYSLSDRIRYYWPNQKVEAALEKLLDNLTQSPPPPTLISQYLPVQYDAIIEGDLKAEPKALILHKIGQVLSKYSYGCQSQNNAKTQGA